MDIRSLVHETARDLSRVSDASHHAVVDGQFQFIYLRRSVYDKAMGHQMPIDGSEADSGLGGSGSIGSAGSTSLLPTLESQRRPGRSGLKALYEVQLNSE